MKSFKIEKAYPGKILDEAISNIIIYFNMRW